MTVDTQELIRYINAQVKTFSILPLKSDFNSGLIEGLNMVKQYIMVFEDREGSRIAKEQGE